MKRQRVRINLHDESPHALEFIPSGSVLLDCVLGGGYPLGRIVNMVGDKSTGKTLLAIEAAVNFIRSYEGDVVYNECEAAFDEAYAESLGLPIKDVRFVRDCDTVESLFDDISSRIDSSRKTGRPCLYILDSLDALSDEAELSRSITDKTYGQTKAKQLGQLFRRCVRAIEQTRMCLFVISQVRTNIGVTFGDTTIRSGGKALDFYASQVVYLSHRKTLTRTRSGVTRAYGILIRAKCKKNKIGLPFRECEFPILFGYGVDDFESCLRWLMEVGGLESLGMSRSEAEYALRHAFDPTKIDREMWLNRMRPVVRKVWNEIDSEFMVPSQKYQ